MKKVIYLSLVTTFLAACSGLVDDLNVNPNSPTSASYQSILTGSQVGNIILQTGESARRAGIFCGYYTGIAAQHQGFDQYSVTTGDFDNLWDDAFVNTLRNAIEAEKAAVSEGIGGITIGITQVMQAQAFGTATALYGDIPFDEAGTLDAENPMFEGQASVYGKLQVLLDEAILNLQSGTGRPATGSDIYYNGNPTAWIQAAYTLKARFYMHTKEYGLAYSAAANGINSHANSMYAPHGTATDNANLNYQFFAVALRRRDVIASNFMGSLVSPNAGTSPNIANYRGNAKTNETARYNHLFAITGEGIQPNIGANGYAAINARAALVTYAENLLIRAEAGARTVDFATGLTHLNTFRSFMSTGGYLVSPVLADVNYAAYVAADFDNGGMENLDGISSDNALLREILEERFVTFFGQIEGFNDVRRTRTESVVRVPISPNTGSSLPQRFLYPQSEIDRNSNTPNPIPGFFDATAVNQ